MNDSKAIVARIQVLLAERASITQSLSMINEQLRLAYETLRVTSPISSAEELRRQRRLAENEKILLRMMPNPNPAPEPPKENANQ